MRIYSWNVNGIRAAWRKGFGDWLAGCGGDIVALQEVRATPEQIPDPLRETGDWHLDVHDASSKAGYSGVASLSRRAPDLVEHGVGEDRFDVEGRIQRLFFGDLLIVNGYFPNGNGPGRDLSRIPYKLDFYRAVFELLEPARRAGKPILVMGDFNTAHQDIDLARPQQNRETSGFRPEEREALDRWLMNGWTDTFREYHKDGERYSWWSQRKGVREKNVGWRIDYVLASPGALEHLRHADIHHAVVGSDHCPISVDVDDEILNPSNRRT